jgi:formamidopyrimidine-DNA glycosylase
MPSPDGAERVPELPEVETVVRELRPHLTGRRITSVEVSGHALRRPWSASWPAALVGRRVRLLRRRGKWIVAGLEGGLHLVLHLGMTGQLVVTAARAPRPPHTHLVLGLDRGGRQLRFTDIRRFGSATLFASPNEVERFFEEAGLGPEPFALDPRYWLERLGGTGRNLKAVLLDQRVVAGVGNIYADESLFAARLHPTRLARQLTAAEAHRLRQAIVAVLTRAIARRGSSIRNYVGGSGRKGEFQEEFSVYGRAGLPCVRCRTSVECIRLAGRATHYCPRCQK